MPRPDVVFVGRANVDLGVRVPYRPGPGQTVLGSQLTTRAGGKSLNQALAVARLGGSASLVANAGADHWGGLLRAALTDAGVDIAHFQLLPGVSTGAAIVELTPDGENSIVLAISPETELTSQQIEEALSPTQTAVVAVQLDMPPEPVTKALAIPSAETIRVGNLVPHQDMDRGLLSRLDVFVVNQHEAAAIIGVATIDPLTAARQLRQLGPAAVVVTAGAGGAAYSHGNRTDTIAAGVVPVVDTTGAGDAFLARLTLDLAHAVPMHDAVAHAVRVGTEAVQHEGANVVAE